MRLALLASAVLLCACGDNFADVTLAIQAVPTSMFQAPASTWWGHNMSKIVRDGEVVYIGVVEDDTVLQPGQPPATAMFNLYRSDGGAAFVKVASALTYRPGNVLVDSHGGIHMMVFEATDPTVNNALGKLVHYAYPSARNNVFTDGTSEIVVHDAPDTGFETVNIRVGAAIADNDDMAVAYGLVSYLDTWQHAEVFYVFDHVSGTWTEHVKHDTPHEFYYPYVAFDSAGAAYAFSVQDDYHDVGGRRYNTYLSADLFRCANGVVDETTIIDRNNDPLALAGREFIVEQSDIFVDSTGVVHVIYKEKLDPDNASYFSHFEHCAGAFGDMQCEPLDAWAAKGTNWGRMFEINGALYAILSSWNEHFITKLGTQTILPLDIDAPHGTYAYLAAPRGGTNVDEDVIDLYMVSGASDAYPGATSVHVSMRKDEVVALFP